MSVKAVPFDEKVLVGIAEAQQEPAWVRRLREDGLNRYTELPIPKLDKTKIDKWNLDEFIPYKSEATVESIASLPEEVRNTVEDNPFAVLVQKHSSVIYSSVQDQHKESGVIVTSLCQALTEHEELVKEYLFQSGIPDNKLIALHQALWSGGVFVYVPKNIEIKEPLQIVQWMDGESLGMLPHLLVVADVNSSVSVAESILYTGQNSSSVMNGMVEIFAKDGAQVQFSSIRSLSCSVTDYTYRCGVTGRDAHIEWLLGDMNEGNTVANTLTLLKGKGSSTDVLSVAVGNGAQKENFVSHVVHEAPHTQSNVLTRGVVFDEASAIFNGITKIEKGAVKSNGQQAENLLVISEKARGDANPMLLIDEEDVLAGHAASVGPADENQLYYLMSRGIPRKEAERLIIHGFLAPVIDRLPGEKMKERLNTLIERKLSI